MQEIIKKFNHLKVHTQYSICKGAILIDDLKDFCKQKEIQSIGLSDDSNLSGALEFSEKISKTGTQPIIGTQIIFKYKDVFGIIPLIANNNIGYKKIIELSSKSYLENSDSSQPFCNFNDLLNNVKGISILSGSINGLIGSLFNMGRLEDIDDVYKKIKNTYKNRMSNVVLVSGYLDHSVVNYAKSLGVTKFLDKPFSANELLECHKGKGSDISIK